MNYKSVESFMCECTIFTHEEKKEIISEAEFLEIDVIDYINYRLKAISLIKKEFKNRINSVLDNDY